MDSLDDEPSPQPDLTEAGIFLFLAIKIQIWHCLWDKLT
jgi:hypothetical protein